MPLIGQLETDLESKAPAALLHEVYSCKPNHISIASPENIQSVDLLEGNWGRTGTVLCWNYVLDGNPEYCKAMIEEIDDENKITTCKVIEGHLIQKYKSFGSVFQVTPKGDGSLVHWTFKYEKLKEDDPEPKSMLQLAVNMIKDMDARLVPQA